MTNRYIQPLQGDNLSHMMVDGTTLIERLEENCEYHEQEDSGPCRVCAEERREAATALAAMEGANEQIAEANFECGKRTRELERQVVVLQQRNESWEKQCTMAQQSNDALQKRVEEAEKFLRHATKIGETWYDTKAENWANEVRAWLKGAP